MSYTTISKVIGCYSEVNHYSRRPKQGRPRLREFLKNSDSSGIFYNRVKSTNIARGFSWD